jgi:hypothetical protein
MHSSASTDLTRRAEGSLSINNTHLTRTESKRLVVDTNPSPGRGHAGSMRGPARFVDNTQVFVPFCSSTPLLTPRTVSAPISATSSSGGGAGHLSTDLYQCILDIKSGVHVGLHALVGVVVAFLSHHFSGTRDEDNVKSNGSIQPNGSLVAKESLGSFSHVPITIRICALRVIQRALRVNSSWATTNRGSTHEERPSVVCVLKYCTRELEQLALVSPRVFLLTKESRQNISPLNNREVHTPTRHLSFIQQSQLSSQFHTQTQQSSVATIHGSDGNKEEIQQRDEDRNQDLELLNQVLCTLTLIVTSSHDSQTCKERVARFATHIYVKREVYPVCDYTCCCDAFAQRLYRGAIS